MCLGCKALTSWEQKRFHWASEANPPVEINSDFVSMFVCLVHCLCAPRATYKRKAGSLKFKDHRRNVAKQVSLRMHLSRSPTILV